MCKHTYNVNICFNIIRWNHSEDWFVHKPEIKRDIKSRERLVEISTNDEDYSYISGHVIDGRNLLPATGYLVLVWKTIGMMKGKMHTTISVIFRDVKFIRATHMSKDVPVNLMISIQKSISKVFFFWKNTLNNVISTMCI